MLISEIFATDPSSLKKKDFLELECFYDRNKHQTCSLQGLKLIGIQDGHGNTGAEIILSINLWNQLCRKRYFAIGSEEYEPLGRDSIDLFTSSSYVNFKGKFLGSGQQSISRMFSNANKVPFALALLDLSREGGQSSTLDISRTRPTVAITNTVKELIKSTVQDLVVYGRKAPFDECNLFNEIYPLWNAYEQPYVLRTVNKESGPQIIQQSLNRCSESRKGFEPFSFKLGDPSPGFENDCHGISSLAMSEQLRQALDPHFVPYVPEQDQEQGQDQDQDQEQEQEPGPGPEPEPEQDLDPEIFEPEVLVDEIDPGEGTSTNTDPQEPSCSATDFTTTSFRNIDNSAKVIKDMITGHKDKQDTCFVAPTMRGGPGMKRNRANIESDIPSKRKLVEEILGQELPVRYDISPDFQDEWTTQIDRYQKEFIYSGSIKANKDWIEYLYNPEHPEESRIRCKPCSKYFEKVHGTGVLKNDLSKREGWLGSSAKKTADKINRHAKSATHNKVVDTITRWEKLAVENALEGAMATSQEDKRYEVTANMFKTVFTEVKLNIPFLSHEPLVTLEQDIGFMGYHHYERTSAHRMAMFMGKMIDDTLIDFMLSREEPFSILLDGATGKL